MAPMGYKFGVWLQSCPKKARKKAAALLAPHIGLVRAEEEVSDAGGRCVAFLRTLTEAEDLARALRLVGAQAGAGEEASWP